MYQAARSTAVNCIHVSYFDAAGSIRLNLPHRCARNNTPRWVGRFWMDHASSELQKSGLKVAFESWSLRRNDWKTLHRLYHVLLT